MSFEIEKKTISTFGIDTFQIAQALLLFALTYSSDLPWWKWLLFVLNYAGVDVRWKRTLTSTDKKESH